MDEKQQVGHCMSEKTKKIKEARMRPSIKKRRVIIPSLCAILIIATGAYMLAYSMIYKKTDNAFVEGSIVSLASKVSGQIVDLYVSDNDEVKEGQLIAQIDPRDYIVRLQGARARLNEAKAKLKINEKQIDESVSNYDLAKKDYIRYHNLYKEGAVSKQAYDKSANILTNTNSQFGAAKNAKMATRAEIERLEAEVAAYKLDLEYTKIYAPQGGKITAKSVERGNYVQVGQPLMAISTDKMWVVANFKENQVTNMKEGQSVAIKIDTYPSVKFIGHIDSIQRSTGAKASLFPPENAVGSYVKIVQRVPVKIVFDKDYSDFKLAPGMSAVPTVKVK